MEKTNNKICSLREYEYDEKTKTLKVKYRGNITKEIKNFTKEDYEILTKANDDKKLLMPVLKKIKKEKNNENKKD